MRAALGASRGRLIGGLLLESGILALAGGALALVGSRWADGLIRRVILTDLAPITSAADGRWIVLTLALSLATAAICGLAPALSIARGNLTREMFNGARGASRPHAQARRILLVAQLALAMILIVGALLFTTTLRNARALHLGMSLDRVLISDLDLSGAGYTPERAHALIDPLVARLGAIPGVRAVGLSNAGPRPGWITYDYSVPGRDSLPAVRAMRGRKNFSAVSSGFLAALGTPILRGRDFTATDRGARVIIVSDAFARLYWPGENPLGRCVNVYGATPSCLEVIGVAHDRRAAPGDTTMLIEAFVPLGSPGEPARLAAIYPLTSVAIRVDGDLARVTAEAQGILQDLLPDAPSIRVRPALSMFDRSVRAWRLGASMFTAFGAIALTLAVLGVYAAITYLVAQRTREIAIRVTLGATAAAVSRLVFGETLRVTVVGIGLGVVGSVVLGRGNRAFLFGVSALSATVFLGAALLLAAAACAATLAPVRRAVNLNLTAALREE